MTLFEKATLDAVQLLETQQWGIKSKTDFWKRNFDKNHQGQLDIIFALEKNGLLTTL